MSKVTETITKRSASGGMAGMDLGQRGSAAEEVLSEAQSADTHRVTAVDVLRFLTVSVYLWWVFLLLVVTGKVRPGNPFKALPRWLIYKLFFRVKEPRELKGFTPETGHCYLAMIHHRILSDLESISSIQVYEDGVPLPYPHADHSRIRKRGLGAFSHWGSAIYLSTSDNSDPRTNGRTYTYKEV